jgi:hypothetical protein
LPKFQGINSKFRGKSLKGDEALAQGLTHFYIRVLMNRNPFRPTGIQMTWPVKAISHLFSFLQLFEAFRFLIG